MIVLSLFDGISCGKVALDRAGIEVTKYYASEIDKDAILISEDNHNDIIRIGDVTKVKYEDGILYTENGEHYVGKIDLLIGGSPCQSFSTAAAYQGNQTGLDGKSKLFYEYLRILKEIKQDNDDVKFLLENVKMSKDNKKMLDEYLNVTGVELNSRLLSIQNRPRIYWANWNWKLPEDKGLSFQDVKGIGITKDCIPNATSSRVRMWNDGNGNNSRGSCANITDSDKVYCLTTKQDRCPNSGMIKHGEFARYLSQNEMEIAQTLNVGYTSCVSYNKAAKALGNGWTVDIISHILSGITYAEKYDDYQLTAQTE